MNKNIIIFNSKCSKCNKTKQYIADSGIEFEVINYLEGELTNSLLALIYDLIEDKASLTRDEIVLNTKESFMKHIMATPEVLQRPIVIMSDKAFVNRPAETFLKYI